MPPSLETLLQDPDIAAQASRFTGFTRLEYTNTLTNTVQELDSFPRPEGLQSYLDSLTDAKDHGYKIEKTINLLEALPPQVLVEQFGEVTSTWLLANASPYTAEEIAKALIEHGYDADLLSRARNMSNLEYTWPKSHEFASHYAAMRMVGQNALNAIDLPTLLLENAKPTTPTKARHLRHYGLMAIRHDTPGRASGPVDDWPGRESVEARTHKQYPMYADAPAGFVFTYKGEPQAITTSHAYRGTEVMIAQMQGVNSRAYDAATGKYIGDRSPWALSRFDWQKLLVDVHESLARHSGFASLGIVSASRVVSRIQYHSNYEQAVQAYDIPASRLLFDKEKAGDRDWHRLIAHAK